MVWLTTATPGELRRAARVAAQELLKAQTRAAELRNRRLFFERCALRVKRDLQASAEVKGWVGVAGPGVKAGQRVRTASHYLVRADVDAGECVFIAAVEFRGFAFARPAEVLVFEDSGLGAPGKPRLCETAGEAVGEAGAAAGSVLLQLAWPVGVSPRRVGSHGWLWVGFGCAEYAIALPPDECAVRLLLCTQDDL
jgi:hypothetical protein